MPMHPQRLTAGILAGLAAVLLLVVQFVPFAGFDVSESGATIDIHGTPWTAKAKASFGGDSQTEDEGWYSDENDESDGIGLIRAGTPILLVGLVACAVACALLLLMPARIGAFAALGATVLAAVGFGLLSGGIMKALREAGDFFGEDPLFLVGFYLGLAALIAVLVAGILALLAPTHVAPAAPHPVAAPGGRTAPVARTPPQAPRRPGAGF